MLKPIPLPGQAPGESGYVEQVARVPPHNFEAEQALLGAILLNNKAIARVSEFLKDYHFAEPLHGRIYQHALTMINQEKLASALTLRHTLGEDPDLIAQGGDGYLARLVGGAATIINALDYGKLTYDLHMRRELIALGEEMVNDAFNPDLGEGAQEQIERASNQLFNLATVDQIGGALLPPDAFLGEVIARAEQSYKRVPGEVSGIATGIVALDRKLGGLQRKDLIFVAGRPSMGKSGLGTTVAYNVARRGPVKIIEDDGEVVEARLGVGIFSLEMGGEENWERIVGYQSKVSPWLIREGPLTAQEFENVQDAARELSGLPLYVDPSPAPSIASMRRRIEALKRRQRVDLVIVDYLQLMGSSEDRRKSGDNRTVELGDMTRSLKRMAKELNVALMVLCQLSRKTEARESKRPQLEDLRESGSIEQDADVVIFIYREQYYLERNPPQRPPAKFGKSAQDIDREYAELIGQYDAQLEKCHNVAELDIAKHRKGRLGLIKTYFDGALIQFDNLAMPDATDGFDR